MDDGAAPVPILATAVKFTLDASGKPLQLPLPVTTREAAVYEEDEENFEETVKLTLGVCDFPNTRSFFPQSTNGMKRSLCLRFLAIFLLVTS